MVLTIFGVQTYRATFCNFGAYTFSTKLPKRVITDYAQRPPYQRTVMKLSSRQQHRGIDEIIFVAVATLQRLFTL